MDPGSSKKRQAEARPEGESSGKRQNVTMESCPVCFHPLGPPVYQINPSTAMSPKRRSNLPHRTTKSRKNGKIMYRCTSDHLLSVMNLINGNDKQKAYVQEIGFGSFLSMANADVGNNKDLTLWLIDKFNCDTEALEFEGGISIPVRPLVKSVLGIPSGPIQVEEGLDVDDALQHQYTCNGNAKIVKEVVDEICKITDKEPFCIGFMMVILAIYLAPNTSLMVNRKLLGAVKQVDKLKEMDWCDFVATYLFKGIKDFKESNVSFVYIKGCVHILSVIFIDFVKHAAFEVPDGFPRLCVITANHFNWVASHPLTSLMVRRPEESIYAAVLDNMAKDGKYVHFKTNTDDLSDNFATTDTDQNKNQHPVSAELDTAVTSPNTTSLPIVEYVHIPTSPGSAAPGSLTGHVIFPRGGKQVQSSKHSEPCFAQIREMMDAAPDAPSGMNSGSTLPIENAGNRSGKKARVDRASSGHAKRAGGAAALDMSLLNCSLCRRAIQPPVFQCKGGHLACGRCLAEFPMERCQTCEHDGDFSPFPAMDFSQCERCETSVPYHQLDDHENACPHAPCYCTEPACSFVGPPQALLGHLIALHFVPVHRFHYGEVRQLRVSEPRYLLHGVEDDSAFLLTVGALGTATVVSAVCIRPDASLSQPQYAVKLSAKGPPLPSSAAGSIQLEMEAVTSSTRAGEVVVEELPSYMIVPPRYLGSSKEATLDIRIDKI